MLQGNYLCGDIHYRYDHARPGLVVCQCRKAQGSAFGANMPLEADHFFLTSGAALINEYESSPGKVRACCRKCGNLIYSKRANAPGALRLRPALIDTSLDSQACYHFYCGLQAEWLPEVDDSIPHYDRPAPGS